MRIQSCSRVFSSRFCVRAGEDGSSTGKRTLGQSNVGKPSRAFLRWVTASAPSVRPWNAPSKETMKYCRSSGSACPGSGAPVFTRLRSTAFIAFSTVSAPVLTTKKRGVPGGAILRSAALRRSERVVWYSECA